jgi:hypothetical protein
MADPTFNQILERAMEDLSGLLSAKAAKQELIEETTDEIRDLMGQIQAQGALVNTLLAAARKYEPDDIPGVDSPEIDSLEPAMNEHLWQSMARTEAIVFALKRLGRPIGPKELTQYLNSHGRHQDTVGAVGATLGHLATDGRVKSLGHGKWLPGPNASAIDHMADDINARLHGGLQLPPNNQRFGPDFTSADQSVDFLGGTE